jgi:hypothetical protein
MKREGGGTIFTLRKANAVRSDGDDEAGVLKDERAAAEAE